MSQDKGNFLLTFVLQVQGADQVTSQFNQVKSGLPVIQTANDGVAFQV